MFVDVEATRSIRKAEVGFERIIAPLIDCWALDSAYGSGPMLGWLVDRKIALHIPAVDKAGRMDGTWSRIRIFARTNGATRLIFERDPETDQYVCPEGQSLKQFRGKYSDPNRGQMIKVLPKIAP